MDEVHVQVWDSELHGPLTLETVRGMHQPLRRHRVSIQRYPPKTTVSGAMRAGIAYVKRGTCRYKFQGEVELTEGEYAWLPEGSFTLEVVGSGELEVILVWELPFDVPPTGS